MPSPALLVSRSATVPDQESVLYRIRHTAAHVLAEAALEYFGRDISFGTGPVTEDGFFYDMELPRPATPEDLAALEARMHSIAARGEPMVREEISRDAARELFARSSQSFKLEILEGIAPGEVVSLFRQGAGFVDLCRGPHLETTADVRHFRLINASAVHWRGREDRPMLQRIAGVAFETAEELDAHLEHQRQAAERDHKRLGRELKLWSVASDVGPGLILWHPRGEALRLAIEDRLRHMLFEAGYDFVSTPHVARLALWERSGHADHFRANMFDPMGVEGEAYQVKPMSCPMHIQIYASEPRSFRDLPLRLAEFAKVYRYERSGVLSGLLRVRAFTQDDAHIFCRPEQVVEEVESPWRQLHLTIDDNYT